MDPVADVLALLRLQMVAVWPSHATQPREQRSHPLVQLGRAIDRECWLTVDGHEPVIVRPGDFFLSSHPALATLSSSPVLASRSAAPAAPSPTGGAPARGPREHDDVGACGFDLTFDGTEASMLFDVLPPLVLVRAGDPREPLLTQISTLIVAEIGATGVGRSLVLEHLAHIALVYILRAHAAEDQRPMGWLAALTSDGIGAALRAMHADVGHRWTLAELAAVSRMSRSGFAASFKSRVGTSPLSYLVEWRMSLARDALRRDAMSISELAAATGYESDSAFSTAFRRVVGSSPQHFRARTRRAAADHSRG